MKYGSVKAGAPSKSRGSSKISSGVMVLVITALLLSGGCVIEEESIPNGVSPETEVNLPEPEYDSSISLEETLLKRRSVRSYKDEPLALQEVSQLLWAAQGTTDSRGFRTAPSAGATYPLEVYLVVGNVENLTEGVYRYQSAGHKLVKIMNGDQREQLMDAALGQTGVRDGAINIIFTAIYERTTRRYGDRGIRYVHMEVGHAAQNVYLQAVALGLGTVVVGAFYDEQVVEILGIPQNERPLYIVPVGKQ